MKFIFWREIVSVNPSLAGDTHQMLGVDRDDGEQAGKADAGFGRETRRGMMSI